MFADLPLWALVLVTLLMTHLTIASVTIYLHRHQAHRALDLHPSVSHLFRFWLWLTTGMVTRQWVAIHRKHHARVETAEDPHSPQVVGIATVLLEGTELYRREACNADTVEQYGHLTPVDLVETALYARYPTVGISAMLVIDLLLFGAAGLTVWAVQMMWIPVFAAGVINGAGHYWGYRNFESADASTNITPLGILIGGEELHNNHHAFASSACFAARRFEFDVGWLYIRILQGLGLARVRKLSPVPFIDRTRNRIDVDTLRALTENRMHVMAQYARHVVSAVYRDERAKADRAARRMLQRGRRLLVRHERLIDAASRQRLEALLGRHPSLQVVYEFRQRLQALWQQRTASHEHLVHGLQAWCEQAEATGIDALREFAAMLKGYSPYPA